MKRGTTTCRRFQKRRDWIRQRLKLTVKIMFFGAAIGSKNYARQEYRAALKHGIRNPEMETETESRKRKQKRKRNAESNINDRKLKNFTLHNLVQSKENLS